MKFNSPILAESFKESCDSVNSVSFTNKAALDSARLSGMSPDGAVNLPGMSGVRLNDKIAFAVPNLISLEKASLEKSIVGNDGCSVPVDVWKDPRDGILYLVDGFARVDICLKHSLPLPSAKLITDILDLEEAVQWRIDQHLARRNLTPWWFSYLWGSKYNLEKLPPYRPSATEVPQNAVLNCRQFAELAGVSVDTIQRDAQFAEAIGILKVDITSQFGWDLLNRKFKLLSKSDIITLAKKPEAVRKTIATTLDSNRKLSLLEAEHAVHQKGEGSGQRVACSREESNATVAVSENCEVPDDIVKWETYKREEIANRERLYGITQLGGTHQYDVPNTVRTLAGEIVRLGELARPEQIPDLISIVEDTVSQLGKIKDTQGRVIQPAAD
jgi:hypothetical protein